MIENMPVKVDDLGRIVIPKKVRKELNINLDDILLLSVKNEKIELKKRNHNTEFDKMIKKLNLLNKEYKLDIILTNNERVVYSSVEGLTDKKIYKDIKKIKINKLFNQEKTILTEDYTIVGTHYYCSFYLDVYTKYSLFIIYNTVKNQTIAKTMCELILI